MLSYTTRTSKIAGEEIIYDVIGVGFGPSNIALAIAMEEGNYPGKVLFIERNTQVSWHEGMLLNGSNIQNNPLRDLVTPVNPRSKYTFVNYLHQSGRLFDFLNLGVTHPLRQDYYDYIVWAGSQFQNVVYGSSVTKIELAYISGQYLWRLTNNQGTNFLTRCLVVGTGRNLNIPKIKGVNSPNVIHFVNYLHHIKKYDKDSPIVVLGASQSAVEIILDLINKGYQQIYSVHRSFSYCLKDTSCFSDEVYFPEFVDYYHGLPPQMRAELDKQLRRTNYSSVDKDILDALYLIRYEDKINHRERLKIYRNCVVDEINPNGKKSILIRQLYKGNIDELPCDLMILATGFLDIGRNGQEGLPKLLRDVADNFVWTDDYLKVERDYRIAMKEGVSLPDIYLNGLCESSHGLGDAGSISLVSLRAQDILGGILKRLSPVVV
ncbi:MULTISPECIES: SidA/IucD/PvdA family monooxygenase [Moorena]|uniref:L-lysine N6-monooxygenase MbtG n=1 Tax=Moorena producens 3L TaxID=489825 RepID=F4XJ41_9CYAN|nr:MULTISPECIES: SidA/IucD/PvdA family monooxygenase [Moorena]EGJ35498.1 lysine/ornithine N-monooxygenase [Moorena producens 3L]NEP33345.1 SidA/IucD/PvdA family monooxygenase [Moorena sp. SIO3B2]NEP69619.1 SidA/IucD/PvdA family monooxygenase [Moorena sp. SIO3A5]NEQ06152.1 SidA/IucD/PvdA family monooxygenase [Moorena sp. SIO4E2]NER89473.1 SidA/IucD/PvdA family monooxygenase [Moorena sp. SIO3A2]